MLLTAIEMMTTVIGTVQQLSFKARGTMNVDLGQQVLDRHMTQEQSAQAKEIKILPNFVEGKTGVHKPSITQGKTTAPKAYNEATFEEP